MSNTMVNPFNYPDNGEALTLTVDGCQLSFDRMIEMSYELSVNSKKPYLRSRLNIHDVNAEEVDINWYLLPDIIDEVKFRLKSILSLKDEHRNRIILESYATTDILKVAYVGEQKEPFDKNKVIVLMLIMNSKRYERISRLDGEYFPPKVLTKNNVLDGIIDSGTTPGFIVDGIDLYNCIVDIYDLAVVIPPFVSAESHEFEIIPLHLNQEIIDNTDMTKIAYEYDMNKFKNSSYHNEYVDIVLDNSYLYASTEPDFVSLLRQVYNIMLDVTTEFNRKIRNLAIEQVVQEILDAKTDDTKDQMILVAKELFEDKMDLGFKPTTPTNLGRVYKKHIELLESLFSDKSDAMKNLIKTAYFNYYPDSSIED